MGILFKLLCPGDLPFKAHKLILNTTTAVSYEEYCHEKHYAEVTIDLWAFDYSGYPLLDNTTNQIIESPEPKIWGVFDRMAMPWEVLIRKLLLKH